MRICLYTATALPKLGGQEAVVDALARHFLRLGHEPMVLAPQPRGKVHKRDGELPYPVFRHPRFYSTRRFVSIYRHFLLRLLARQKVDLIHCHDVYPTGYVASLCRRQMPLPLVITSHGGDVKEGNIRISKPGMRPRYQQAIRAADALISIGRFTEEGFRALVPDGPPIHSIPNGIDFDPYDRPAPRPADLDARIQPGEYCLFLGRLKKRKGVDVLLDAMAQLPAAENIELVIAGVGEEQAAIELQIARLKLNDRVRLVGRVDGDAKIWLLQNALATVMPSTMWEAFPLVLLESAAAGRPIIGTRVPGIVDLIDPGVTGLLAAAESANELAEAMKTVRSDRTRADEMGRAARRFAEQYSWDAVARRHIELYEELVRRG
jgi:glycosyltransferase involved in cell wall biosynthesis